MAADLLSAFPASRSGSVNLIFALLLPVLLLLSGAAIDVGRWLQARGAAQSALSAASVAGARMMQLTGGNTHLSAGSAREAFLSNLEGAGVDRLDIGAMVFDADSNGGSFATRATAWIDTPMLALVGLERLKVVDSGAGKDAATNGGFRVETGAKLGTSNEVALALDLSENMAGPLLVSLKKALVELVDIVVWPDQQQATSRVGLVPFADAVNVGPHMAAVTGGLRPGMCTTAGCQRLSFRRQDVANCVAASPTPSTDCRTRIFSASACVTGRRDPRIANDSSPAIAPIEPHYPNASGICRVGTAVQPLTSSKAALHGAIESLQAGGAAAPHLGLAWVWHLLSPEWSAVWAADSAAASYQQHRLKLPNGRPQLRKIAIVVQSGSPTLQHCQGVDDRLVNCPVLAGRSALQARQLCIGMRQRGIEIYVVAVGLGSASRELEEVLRDQCAGRDNVYYAVETGEQLRQAFRDIALDIAPLVLAQ